MSASLDVRPARRLLSGILTVLAAVGGVACDAARDPYEVDVAYRPTERIGDAGGNWPELPCVPRTDPKLFGLAPCGAEDFRVTDGPVQAADEQGRSVCRYRIAYTLPAGSQCVFGRPLTDVAGGIRTASLAVGLAGSGREVMGWT